MYGGTDVDAEGSRLYHSKQTGKKKYVHPYTKLYPHHVFEIRQWHFHQSKIGCTLICSHIYRILVLYSFTNSLITKSMNNSFRSKTQKTFDFSWAKAEYFIWTDCKWDNLLWTRSVQFTSRSYLHTLESQVTLPPVSEKLSHCFLWITSVSTFYDCLFQEISQWLSACR